MPSKLEEKVAVITGGTSGLGLATAERFVADLGHRSPSAGRLRGHGTNPKWAGGVEVADARNFLG